MNNKKSFVFYHSWGEVLSVMSDEDVGKIVKMMIAYSETGIVEKSKPEHNIAFGFMKIQMDADAEKYDEVCERRSEAGKKGGRPKKDEKAKKAKGFFDKDEKAKKAKKADDEDDDVDDNDINTLINECDNITHARESTPTLKEVQNFIQKENLKVDADKFFNHYTSLKWKTALGVPIADWKAKARVWSSVDENKTNYIERIGGYDESVYADTSNLEV